MLSNVAILIVASTLLADRGQYEPLSGTVVSGIAGSYAGRGDSGPFVGAPGVTLYCAERKFDKGFSEWIAVWGEDRTDGPKGNPGGFHFYHSRHLKHGISLVYLWTCEGESGGNTPSYFSNSYDTKLVERQGQRGKRYEVKARLILHPTNKPFAKASDAVATIREIVKSQWIALRLDIKSGNREDDRPIEPAAAKRAACAAI